ncbi:hypothetical protein ACFFQW_42905 [Umezawaea endophytica]|uniref:Uncharacterized protein n=1 Tax=Umezawaea endophytica TaxID=1654476 RepID=A0A9X2VS27_9PSEU|nr:hypothetical protein [Umezawaea endophytica]MCS7481162.1 hypothetical protein [Umezawaea endophytica]
MIDREPLSSDLGDLRNDPVRPVRKTITLHDRGVAAPRSVALLPTPAPAPVRPPEPEVRTRWRVTPRVVGVLVLFGGLAAVIVTAFGVSGVLMLIGLCVALRLMWTDRAGR